MKSSLVLNKEDQIALFYDEVLGFIPEWASIDVDLGEVYICGDDEHSKAIKLDRIDTRIYKRIKSEAQILLVRVENNDERSPVDARVISLMISQQL